MENEDKILAAIEESEPKVGEYEVHEQRKGAVIGVCASFIFGLIMCFVEYLITHRYDFGKLSIIFLIVVISELYEGIKFKKKKQIIAGIIYFVMFAICLILYVGALLK